MVIPDTEPSELLTSIVGELAGNSAVNREIMLMRERRELFPSQLAADLAGIYMNPVARAYLDARLDEAWRDNSSVYSRERVRGTREHVIGAGVHAAIYAATRARMGKGRPVVWEMRAPGGAFSVGGGKPVFWLQSRNRPGIPGIPEQGNLNYLPGAVLQPSHISAGEYPDNAAVRYCIRATLAAYADVQLDTVRSYADDYSISITTQRYGRFDVGRVIDARGMGTDSAALLPERRMHIVTFFEFMDRMSTPFPLKGVRRLAVIGGGASGRGAIEAAVGIGPASHFSMPELDWVRQIDWYASGLPGTNFENWVQNEQRPRSLEIARYLPRADTARKSESRRLRTFNQPATPVDGPESASIGSRSYDLVVVCAGLARRDGAMATVPGPASWAEFAPPSGGISVARRLQAREVYAVGPVAKLPTTPNERNSLLTETVPGNEVSILRYGPKTASLAMALD